MLQFELFVQGYDTLPIQPLAGCAGQPKLSASFHFEDSRFVFDPNIWPEIYLPDACAAVAQKKIGRLLMVKHLLENVLDRHLAQCRLLRLQLGPEQQAPHRYPEDGNDNGEQSVHRGGIGRTIRW
jgi:hypothetical protein